MLIVNTRTKRHGRRTRRALLSGLLCLTLSGALVAGTTRHARAEDRIWATGRVVNEAGQPLADALVAVYDDSNKVVDYARTDKNGEYALALPTRALHIQVKHDQGFFTQVWGSVTRFVGDAAGMVSVPLRAGVHALSAAESADMDPVSRSGIAAGGAVVDLTLKALTPTRRNVVQEERKQPGALLMKVVTNGKADLVGVGRIYWMQQEIFKAGGKQKENLAAWLDPVRMMPVESEKPSTIDSQYMRFTAARLEPSLAEPGQRVRIVAKLPPPPDPPIFPVVIARNNRTGQTWELTSKGNGIFEGEFVIDRKFPRDDQTISLLAYASKTETPGRRPDAERAIEHAGYWDLKKPYLYDPLLVISRNRADLVLTVIGADKNKR